MIIGISGKKEAGKTYTANQIKNYFDRNIGNGYSTSWEIHSYAEPLKKMLAPMLGVHWTQLSNHDVKKMLVPDHVKRLMNDLLNESCDYTVRDLMQKFATDVIRKRVPDFWIKSALSSYSNTGVNWIIDDVRFLDEVEAIKNLGGIVIRINPIGIDTSDTHESEVALDNFTGFDLEVTNDHTLGKYEYNILISNKLKNILTLLKNCIYE